MPIPLELTVVDELGVVRPKTTVTLWTSDETAATVNSRGRQSLLLAIIDGNGRLFHARIVLRVGSSRVDLQACKLEYSIVSPK